MEYWERAPRSRGQLVLFPTRLDEAVPPGHDVRLFDAILGKIDWTDWESRYNGRRGRPPIHPRVLAGVLLYGVLTRIRASRVLEDALSMRLDFLWLAEGRSIDHTTLSEFRRKFAPELKDLFVKIGVVARQLGFLSLTLLAFDGTRIRANNRRSGTRSRAELEAMQAALATKFEESEAKAAADDLRDDQALASSPEDRARALDQIRREQEKIAAALAELDRAQAAGEQIPKRIPLTDPESRVLPNKEGGFAPNYTPLATVDVASGLIVLPDVIAGTDENRHLAEAVDGVTERFNLEKKPEMLADGAMATADNLALMEARGVTFYSPIAIPDPTTNPAVRDDPTRPVPEDKWEQLPSKPIGGRGKDSKRRQLTKAAFVYDAERDRYYCPNGQVLPYVHTTSEKSKGRRIVRRRYKSDANVCAACPLRERCLRSGGKQRHVSREPGDPLREAHAKHMATDAAKAKYALRSHAAERPFAMIKHRFGARRFLLRGLEQVRIEWTWLAAAFNLHRLIHLIRSRAGPEAALVVQ